MRISSSFIMKDIIRGPGLCVGLVQIKYNMRLKTFGGRHNRLSCQIGMISYPQTSHVSWQSWYVTHYSINISCLEYKLHQKLLCGDLAWQLNPALCSFGQAAYSIVEVLQHPSWFDTVLILLLQLCILKLTDCFFRLALAYYLSVFTQVWIEGQHHANLEG